MAKSKKKAVEQTTVAAPVETITTYKGFDKDLKCRGFQYEIGKTYTHEGEVKACGSGFHACEHPLDVLGYYPPSQSRYAVVEQSGDLSRENGGDTKVASRSISLKFEISIADLVKFAIDYTFSKCTPVDPESPASATGEQGAASATGNYGAASATGEHSVACGLGWQNKAKACETGAIVLTYRNYEDEIIHIRASKVGENGIKADTWYQLNEDGDFVEVEGE